MTKKLGKIPFHKLTVNAAKEKVSEIIKTSTRCQQVIVANSYSLVLANKNPEFAKVCNSADVVFADGKPIVWVSFLLGDRIPKRITGADFMWEFSAVCAQEKFNVFLLGSEEPYLSQLKANLEESFPGLDIVGTYSPPFGLWDEEENIKIVSLVNKSKADIVWVGISTPKQDLWIAEHKNELNTKVAIGVGAAFDFHSGRVKRAPRWMQKIGLEWLYRFKQDPKRLWKRYLIGNLQFIGIVIKEVIISRFKPAS